MNVVVDASVAMKWFVEEDLSDEAERLTGDEFDLLAPELMWIEVVYALGRRQRRREFSMPTLKVMVDQVFGLPVVCRSMQPLLPNAAEMSLALAHSAYDCVYLALAVSEQCRVVTADDRFAAAAERGGYGEHLLRLEHVA